MPLLLALVLSVAGVNIAWRWAKLGGAMAVAGGLTMIALVTLASGPDGLLGVVLFAFPVLFAGVLHLAYSVSLSVAARAERPEPAPVRRRQLQAAT
jgi:hypothetical protein